MVRPLADNGPLLRSRLRARDMRGGAAASRAGLRWMRPSRRDRGRRS
jgi:hypothetical protein